MSCKNIFVSGSKLKFYMEQQGITSEQLSEGTGISAKTIQRYRTGENMPSLENAYAISDYLNIRIDVIWCVFNKNVTK